VSTAVNKKSLVKFAPKGGDNFYDVMKQEVDNYFRTNSIGQHANTTMVLKTIMMLSLYFVPYIFIVTGLASVSPWVFYSLWVIMGVGIVGIGTGIMHDSNHGAYSENKTVNMALGSLLNFIGGYDRNWRIQHNILHHTYTNLDGLDEDIAGTVLIRMCPHKKRLPIHRFQHIYAWFLYALMNLTWVVLKDFKLIFRYEKEGLLKKEKVTLGRAFAELIVLKLFYIGNILVLPILFSDMTVGQVFLGFLMMHVVAGLSLACIFQPAHVMETSSFPLPNDERKMEESWARHQLMNTTNFAPGSRITAWFIGGLNYQIEHHLFPQICHIHYPKLSKIVKSVAERHGMPYNVQPTFAKAIWEHGRMLHILSRKESDVKG
jgi:linoleoyl-CoA desaturase